MEAAAESGPRSTAGWLRARIHLAPLRIFAVVTGGSLRGPTSRGNSVILKVLHVGFTSRLGVLFGRRVLAANEPIQVFHRVLTIVISREKGHSPARGGPGLLWVPVLSRQAHYDSAVFFRAAQELQRVWG